MVLLELCKTVLLRLKSISMRYLDMVKDVNAQARQSVRKTC